MNVIGAVPSMFGGVFSRHRRFHQSSPSGIHLAGRFVLRVKFSLGLKPMDCLVAVSPTGFFPNLMGPSSNGFVADQRIGIHIPEFDIVFFDPFMQLFICWS
jgi:hypothetical protein